MDKFKKYETLCRVCLSTTEDLERNNQLISLNKVQTEKLTYIGDSSEIVGLHETPLILCLHCHKTLDWVYDFVVKFNSSKAKIKEFARLYSGDSYQVDDLNLETIDTTEGFSDSDNDTFYNIVKVETPSPTFESAPRTVSPVRNVALEPNTLNQNYIEPKPKPKAKMNPKFKIKEQKPGNINQQAIESCSIMVADNVCHLCAKQFSTRTNMRRHVRKHFTGRRFVCCYENCRKFFTQKSALKVHNARHEGHKPYECTTCGKRFSQNHSLELHIRIHTGESPYECDYCQKSFKQKWNLIRHFKTHRYREPRVKRFECTKCKKCLASKQSLMRHLSNHRKLP